MNPLLKDAVAMLRQHGLAAHIENGSHIRVRFTNSFGTHCLLVLSRTPSDQAAIKKSRAQLRRLLRRAIDDRP
jgi:hypothetical protein